MDSGIKDENQIDSNNIKNNESYKTFKAILNDPTKAIRLAIFNADRHNNADAFYKWEKGGEIGCSQGIINAYNVTLEERNFDKELSLDIIIKSRLGLVNDIIYGAYKEEEHVAVKTAEEMKNKIISIPTNPNPSYGIPFKIGSEDRERITGRLREDAEELRKKLNMECPPYFMAMRRVWGIAGAITDAEEIKGITNRRIKMYNEDIKKSEKDHDKVTPILEFCRDLERMHLFSDFNCRTFCVLILNRELIKNNLSPALMADPNVFDYQSIDELKKSLQVGQENFINLVNTGKACAYDKSNQEWRDYIKLQGNTEEILKTFDHLTKDQYKPDIGIKQEEEKKGNNNSKATQEEEKKREHSKENTQKLVSKVQNKQNTQVHTNTKIVTPGQPPKLSPRNSNSF